MARGWILMVIMLAALIGCDREPETTITPVATTSGAPVPNPTTAPATTAPAITLPTESILVIDGQAVAFPPAKLRVDEDDGQVMAILFSDDPPAAINPDYDGNSFYMEIPLDIASAKDLPEGSYLYRRDSAEFLDTPYGIFLEGRRWQLQPDEVRVEFAGDATLADVSMTGSFLLYDTEEPKSLPKQVTVAGNLVAPVMVR